MKRGCSVAGCETRHKGHGFCDKHLGRFKRFGDPLAGGDFRARKSPEECIADGCRSKVTGRGLCAKHYRRKKLYGDVGGGKFHHSDHRREWHIGHDGYVIRYDPQSPYRMPNGYIYQHRQVMGEIIGRPLAQRENVHHKNGVKNDNRPDNLEMWISSQPGGQRVQDVVSWARIVLEKYGDLVDRMNL